MNVEIAVTQFFIGHLLRATFSAANARRKDELDSPPRGPELLYCAFGTCTVATEPRTQAAFEPVSERAAHPLFAPSFWGS